MSGQTLIALITAVTSLVVSVVTAAVSSSFRRRSETELAKLKNQLTEEQSERAARRAYVYDARKRLYLLAPSALFRCPMRSRRSGICAMRANCRWADVFEATDFLLRVTR